MLNAKPYQLSRLSTKKSSVSGLSNDKHSDFFIYEDESDSYEEGPLPPPQNIRNDLFLYNPPHNSLQTFFNGSMYPSKENNQTEISNNYFEVAEHQSTILIDAAQPSSNHLLFNNDATSPQNASNSSNTSNTGNKSSMTSKNASLKKINYRQPPPIKKPSRAANNEMNLEEMQANLPSVLIINSNTNSSTGNRVKTEETSNNQNPV